jgi:hypothetical protein
MRVRHGILQGPNGDQLERVHLLWDVDTDEIVVSTDPFLVPAERESDEDTPEDIQAREGLLGLAAAEGWEVVQPG